MAQQAIENLEKEVTELRLRLRTKEKELADLKFRIKIELDKDSLGKEEISKFSRQIILPAIGVKGQIALKKSKVLIVGLGGLGCPVALYLTGAGVGHLGLVDYDCVEQSNLHRQLLHTEDKVGLPKVTSAAQALKRLNHSLFVDEFHLQLNSCNALDIIRQFDVIIDGTDNVATRYLLNDACVLSGRPLVSGSALRLEGQLTVYNYNGGPCYRCIFPTPPPPDTVTSCGDGGVLGVVPGIIGVLQALECIKVILGWSTTLCNQLLLLDAENSSFRCVRLRNRNPLCCVCGSNPSITSLIDYEQFCGAKANDKGSGVELLSKDERISAAELKEILASRKEVLLIDVRNPEEYEMCALAQSINIPMKCIENDEFLENFFLDDTRQQQNVYVICRRGNDSQKAVKRLKKIAADAVIKDVEGGLHSWAYNVDANFPVY